jgi:hypothetical protein
LGDRPFEVSVKSLFIPTIFQVMKQQQPEINGGPDADYGQANDRNTEYPTFAMAGTLAASRTVIKLFDR